MFIKRLFGVLGVSSLLSIGLSLIPILQIDSPLKEVSVFEPVKVEKLTEQSMVDFLSKYSLHIEIQQASLGHEVLFVRAKKPPHVTEEGLYEQIFLILKQCFVDFDNIQMVRLDVSLSQTERFLLEANRQDLLKDLKMLNPHRVSYKKYIRQAFLLYGK